MDLHQALSRLLAAPCAICATNRGAPLVCVDCRRDFLAPETPRCEQCAIPLPNAAPACGRCQSEPPHFDATVALTDYAAPIDGLVGALKFGHRLELAALLGELLAERIRPTFDAQALVVAVPLAFERQARRGFNQSFEIARTAAARLGTTVARDLLVRLRPAPPQASLELAARRRNVRGAFAADRGVLGRRVVVVDDVLTTGSTLDEVARVLKAAGAIRVTNLVVARTP